MKVKSRASSNTSQVGRFLPGELYVVRNTNEFDRGIALHVPGNVIWRAAITVGTCFFIISKKENFNFLGDVPLYTCFVMIKDKLWTMHIKESESSRFECISQKKQ